MSFIFCSISIIYLVFPIVMKRKIIFFANRYASFKQCSVSYYSVFFKEPYISHSLQSIYLNLIALLTNIKFIAAHMEYTLRQHSYATLNYREIRANRFSLIYRSPLLCFKTQFGFYICFC